MQLTGKKALSGLQRNATHRPLADHWQEEMNCQSSKPVALSSNEKKMYSNRRIEVIIFDCP